MFKKCCTFTKQAAFSTPKCYGAFLLTPNKTKKAFNDNKAVLTSILNLAEEFITTLELRFGMRLVLFLLAFVEQFPGWYGTTGLRCRVRGR